MGTLTTSVVFVRQFIQHFAAFFSGRQLLIIGTVLLGWFMKHTRLSLVGLAEDAGLAYHVVRYIILRSKWVVISILNRQRLEIICCHQGTAPAMCGILIIDDMGNVKRYSFKIEGVALQYSGSEHGLAKCLNAVFLAYSDPNKHFPVFWEPYRVEGDFPLGKADPKFQSKIDIALKQLREIAPDARFPRIVAVDSWYMATELIKEADALGFIVIGEIDCDRKFLFHRPDTGRKEYIKRDELVKLVLKYYSCRLKTLTRKGKRGKSYTVRYFSFESKLNGCPVPGRAVVIMGRHFSWDYPNAVRMLWAA